jgi:inner membrane transporter RhtA
VAAFGVTLAIMNFSFYQAFARIPLGIAMVVAALLVTPAAAAGSAGRGDRFRLAVIGTGIAASAGAARANGPAPGDPVPPNPG